MSQSTGINVISYLARQEGVSESEIRKELELAIEIGMNNSDESVQKCWREMQCEGDKPTPEEVISYLVEKVEIC